MDCLAIGSLPHKNPQDALNIAQNFDIPFWPQLTKRNEDMTFQFLEGMPSFLSGTAINSESILENLEQFFMDYEEIMSGNEDLLEKYAINDSLTFKGFLELARGKKFAKGQIVGPFTLSTTLTDESGKCAIYDETLREIIVKLLTLKALWQIKHIKSVGAKPIIFIDEPSLSQLGTSAYITIATNEVIDMLKEITDIIKQNGAIPAIHCCGKCDWSIPIKTGIEMISLDAYTYAENLSIFSSDVEKFLQNGGKIVWGVVPTLDKSALETADLKKIIEKFDNAVTYLTKKGINEKLIKDNSLVSPSCGAGSLSVDLAQKAIDLTIELSKYLKERYDDN